jgi:hypothetical protein
MPLFNFKPIELRDATKCVDCPHLNDSPLRDKYVDAQVCKAMPRFRNRIYYVGLKQDTLEPYVIGEKDRRPEWCPLEPVLT